LIAKIARKEFLHVLISGIADVVMINFEEDFPESFNLFLVNFASVCDNVLNALPEEK
jgi:hypothetical protein